MRNFARFCALMLFAFVPVKGASAQDLANSAWRVTFDSAAYGLVESRLQFEKTPSGFSVMSQSGAASVIKKLPDASELNIGASILTMEISGGPDTYTGKASFLGQTSDVTLKVTAAGIDGAISTGALAGAFNGVATAESGPLRDYPAIFDALLSVTKEKIFDPKELDNPSYRLYCDRMKSVARNANDDLDFMAGFAMAWMNDPFSHYDLSRSEAPVEAMLAYFDEIRIGSQAARVSFDGDVAILDVDTMMGLDTIEYIIAAYKEIAANGAKALVIDLRDNAGGAFAIVPLVSHATETPIDAGYFLSQKWNVAHNNLPSREEVDAQPLWDDWSILSFWKTVQEQGILKVMFEPAEPTFVGPIFVVVNNKTASAAELAADAFRVSGRAVLVGEKTAGQMLSQSPFEVAEGFKINLPIADYYSMEHGRIEGVGIEPDIEVNSDKALEHAVSLARDSIQ